MCLYSQLLVRQLCILVGFLMWTPALWAQTPVHPATVINSSMAEASLGFSTSTIEVEMDSISRDVERKILFGEFAMNVAPDINAFGQLGLTTSTEVEKVNKDGDGYLFAGGITAKVHQIDKAEIMAQGVVHYVTDEIDLDGGKLELSMFDLIGGISSVFRMSPMFHPYVGLDLVLFSDGEIEAGGDKENIERENILNLVIGTDILFSKLTIKPQVVLMGESAFSITGAYMF